jgi:hypothetical protein
MIDGEFGHAEGTVRHGVHNIWVRSSQKFIIKILEDECRKSTESGLVDYRTQLERCVDRCFQLVATAYRDQKMPKDIPEEFLISMNVKVIKRLERIFAVYEY